MSMMCWALGPEAAPSAVHRVITDDVLTTSQDIVHLACSSTLWHRQAALFVLLESMRSHDLLRRLFVAYYVVLSNETEYWGHGGMEGCIQTCSNMQQVQYVYRKDRFSLSF